MSLKQSGSCVRCGASIFIDETKLASGQVPVPQYSCVCPRAAISNEGKPVSGKVLES
jgi:hypothetical protein